MTGWFPGVENLYACPEFRPDPDAPGRCKFWLAAWACRRNDAGPCLWQGQPPKQAYIQGPPEDCHD